MLQKLINQLYKPVDISSTAFFRIAFGAILLVEVGRYFGSNWIETYWIRPKFYFTFEWFHWVRPLEGYNMYVLFLAMGIAAFCVMLGLFYRYARWVVFLGFTYIFLLDKTNYLNHFYLISLLGFMMCLIPANKGFSLDARLWPEIRSDYVPFWMPALLAFNLGVAYFYGGIAKINMDWLQGQPMYIWLGRQTDFPVIGQYFDEPWMVLFMSYSGLLLDLLIVPGLLWKKTRAISYIFITAFHVMNHFLWVIGIFPWFMIAATTIFFKPDWFRNLLSKLPNEKWHVPLEKGVKIPKFQPYTPLLVFLALYCSAQLLIPFRHHLFKGDVNWNEKGHRFSWHMKLRDKRSRATFYVKNLDTGEKIKVDQKDFLSTRQRRKMSMRPDMILQFAHYLGDQYRDADAPNIAVYADIESSLNGREYQQLIWPDVNLLEIKQSTPSEKWIVPLTTPLRTP